MKSLSFVKCGSTHLDPSGKGDLWVFVGLNTFRITGAFTWGPRQPRSRARTAVSAPPQAALPPSTGSWFAKHISLRSGSREFSFSRGYATHFWSARVWHESVPNRLSVRTCGWIGQMDNIWTLCSPPHHGIHHVWSESVSKLVKEGASSVRSPFLAILQRAPFMCSSAGTPSHLSPKRKGASPHQGCLLCPLHLETDGFYKCTCVLHVISVLQTPQWLPGYFWSSPNTYRCS